MSAKILAFSKVNKLPDMAIPLNKPGSSNARRGLLFRLVDSFQESLDYFNMGISIPPDLPRKFGKNGYMLRDECPEVANLTEQQRVFAMYKMCETEHNYWIETHQLALEDEVVRFMPMPMIGLAGFRRYLAPTIIYLFKTLDLVEDESAYPLQLVKYLLRRRDAFCEKHCLDNYKSLEDFIQHEAWRYTPMSEQDIELLSKNEDLVATIAEGVISANQGYFV